MDPLSHAMVGGIAAVSICRNPKILRLAAICGIAAGIAPDLDILIRSADNPMLGLAFHRHFTHSLAFSPFGGLLIAAAIWFLSKKKTGFIWLFLFCFLGFALHGLLDAMTNYGSHLFWPFTMRRESWSIISIVDPIFTLTLLALLGLACWKKSRKFALIGTIFASSYWLVGYYQREQATIAMHELAISRGHIVERFEVKPSLGNLLLWRVQYLHQGNIFIDAVHASPWHGKIIYNGGSLPLYTQTEKPSQLQQKDLDYFRFFSDGWIAYDPENAGLIGDVRFAMLPDQITPLWGIRLQPDKPSAHVLFENVRKRKAGDVYRLWEMIQGRKLQEIK
jgi:inner membrane protein